MARGQNFYKVTIESGVNDPSKYQSRTFIIDEEDDQLLFILLQRIKTRQSEWDQQQQRRANEERRKAQEARRNEQRRQQQEQNRRQGNSYHGTFTEDQYSRLFEDLYGNPNFRAGPGFFGHDDGFRTNPRPGTRPTVKSKKEQLADFAHIDWVVAQNMEIKALLKKAQRRCHPDTGGSHEKWVALDKLRREMGL